MNYCEKIHYTILSTKRAEFAVMVDDLLSQLPQNEVIMRLAFSVLRVRMRNTWHAGFCCGRKSVGIMGIANRL